MQRTAVAVQPPRLFFSTKASQTLPGGLGTLNEDIYQFNPTQLGATTNGSFADNLTLDGSSFDLSGFALDAIHLEWVTPQSDLPIEGLTPTAPAASAASATPFASARQDEGGRDVLFALLSAKNENGRDALANEVTRLT